MTKRKHRLYIDVTYSCPLTQREAAKGLQMTIDDRLDLAKGPVWFYDNSPYIDKIKIVEKQS